MISRSLGLDEAGGGKSVGDLATGRVAPVAGHHKGGNVDRCEALSASRSGLPEQSRKTADLLGRGDMGCAIPSLPLTGDGRSVWFDRP